MYIPAPRGYGRAVSCGQCLPCRVNDRRKKTFRLMLESWCHPRTAFLTTTYDPEHLPLALDWDGCPVGTLEPDHHRVFIRRLRDHLGGPRWFGVGEYGGETGRPHYHYLVFGREADEVGDAARRAWTDEDGRPRCHPRLITSTEAVQERLAYMAGYTVDKLKRRPEELGPREPEFMRQSLNPAIGLSEDALSHILKLSDTRAAQISREETLDVPREVRVGPKLWPLDRRIRMKWRDAVGLPQVDLMRPQVHVRNPTAPELEHARDRERKLKLRRRGAM